jgi:hypothetical protein
VTRVRLAALLAAISLGCVTAIHAHHSSGMFELTNAIWMQGTIVRFDRINPHSIITLEEKTRDGQVRRWAIEGPDAGQLNRRGVALDFLKAGDVVSFCGFPMKAEWLTQRSAVGADGVPQRWVHGHVVVRNGQKSIWGSYGTLSACIRSSSEPRESWVTVLNSDLRFQETWCVQRGRKPTQDDESLRTYVDEMTRVLNRPCG